MIETIINKSGGFEWVDAFEPTDAELAKIAKDHGLHATSVRDCLDPEHLPKFEHIEPLSFAIFRSFDERCDRRADTVQELTRKVAVFYSATLIITIHRKEQPYIRKIKEKWRSETILGRPQISEVMREIIAGAIASYEAPIDHALNDLELFEMGVFGAEGARPFKIKDGYYLKRRASVMKRILRLTLDNLPKVTANLSIPAPHIQELKEAAESSLFFADELMESVGSLLNLHMSFSTQKTNEASHRINEVIRVLTIYSVFLLPLNVITGIYGMNFEHMPELKSVYAYPIVLTTMVLITASTYIWFRRKGWLK